MQDHRVELVVRMADRRTVGLQGRQVRVLALLELTRHDGIEARSSQKVAHQLVVVDDLVPPPPHEIVQQQGG